MVEEARVSTDTIVAISGALYRVTTAIPDAGIEDDLKHLVSLRASQLNGCAFCLAMHVRDLRNAGWREDKIAVLPAWRETTWYTPREQAALA
ncbi:MAG: carboxymuconolactone decarboxylase family protein, partial [Thermomicrobiales bacterium]